MSVKITPSLMCADYLNMGAAVQEMNKLDIEAYHVDVMDGLFVENFAFNPDMIKAVKAVAEKPLIVHLMCVDPGRYVDVFADAGSDFIVFHVESTNQSFKLIEQIRRRGCKTGIALNPSTPVDHVKDLLPLLDIVTVMTIEPGFAGQSFMEHSYRRITELKSMISESGSSALLEIDGGITVETGKASLDAGADLLVGGYFCTFQKGMGITESYNDYIRRFQNEY